MGNAPVKLNDLTTEKKATQLLTPALNELKKDWARALGIRNRAEKFLTIFFFIKILNYTHLFLRSRCIEC